VTNDGPAPASGVEVSDPLPDGVSFLSATPTQGTCVGGQVVTCVLGSLAAGDSASVDVEVNTTAAATVVNAASASAVEPDPNPANNSDSARTKVLPVADVSVTGADAPDPVLAGATLVYTLRVRNAGPDAATGVELTDLLSPEVAFVAGEAGQGPGCADADGIVHCAIGNLAPESTADVVIEVRPLHEGVVTNVAAVAALEFDPDPSNDYAEVDTTVLPAVNQSATIGESQDPVVRNQTVTYTILVGNAGPSAATGATLAVSFATDPKFESMTTNQGSCTVNSKLGTASCELGLLPRRWDSGGHPHAEGRGQGQQPALGLRVGVGARARPPWGERHGSGGDPDGGQAGSGPSYPLIHVAWSSA
jgi:large repetitive protein